MIGSAIRKFARERGMKTDNGYAYGLLHGLHVAMNEGGGWKAVSIYLHPTIENTPENAALRHQVLEILTDCNLKEYRLTLKDSIEFSGGFVWLKFHDTIGTMKRIERYLDEMLPRLATLGIVSSRCAYCGEPMGCDLRYTHLNGLVMPVHGGCVQDFSNQIDIIEEENFSRGSVLLGAIGALLGAVLGAAVWALVYSLGYIAGIVGFVIGFLANFFYGKFGGKRSGLRIVIVVLALLVGSVLGQTAGVAIEFMSVYDEMDLQNEVSPVEWLQINMEQFLLYDQETALGMRYDREIQEVPEDEIEYVMTREEYIETYYNPIVDEGRNEIRAAYIKDLGIGLLFGVWGCSGLFREVYQKNKRRKVKELG